MGSQDWQWAGCKEHQGGGPTLGRVFLQQIKDWAGHPAQPCASTIKSVLGVVLLEGWLSLYRLQNCPIPLPFSPGERIKP